MPEHAILSPSAAYRWMVCTPSARFEEQIPEESSVYAEEGSIAHEVAAMILKGWTLSDLQKHPIKEKALRFYAETVKGSTGSEWEDMLDYGIQWAKHVKERNPDTIKIETKVDMRRIAPCSFGTADAISWKDTTLYVDDYKYGQGILVKAEANPQLMLYAIGALLTDIFEEPPIFTEVTMSIFQPRAGGSSSFTMSADDLMGWGLKEVKPSALKAISGEGEFITGKHCQMCKARTRCKAFFDTFAEMVELTDERVMSPQERAWFLDNGDAVGKWIKATQADCVNRLILGESIPGYKAVAGRGRRSFTDENAVEDALLGEGFDNIYNHSLLSLTDLEKALGKKRFTELLGQFITTQEGAPTYAKIGDKRPSLSESRADDYTNEEDELL